MKTKPQKHPDKRTRQTVAKLMAAIDRTLRAVEAVKQARQELSRLTSDAREGGASNDAA